MTSEFELASGVTFCAPICCSSLRPHPNLVLVGARLVVEYTRYKIDEKRRTLFERVYEKAGEALASSIHCLHYELSHCTEDPHNYILRIEWDSEEGHLKGFRTSPQFKTFFALVQPYVNDIEEMRHYKVISAVKKSQLASHN